MSGSLVLECVKSDRVTSCWRILYSLCSDDAISHPIPPHINLMIIDLCVDEKSWCV